MTKGRGRLFPGLALLATLSLGSGVAADTIGDATHGAQVFQSQCAICHDIGNGAKNRIGPLLNGIYGRRAAMSPGFDYSKSMQRMGNDGLTWTLETLDPYLANPKALVSGTKMAYKGVKDDAARQDLLAFLRDWSDRPSDIPEAEPTARRSLPALTPEILAIKGDRDYGQYLSAECATCHQRDGSDQGYPLDHPLAGRRFRCGHACLQGEAAPASRDADDGRSPVQRRDCRPRRLFRDDQLTETPNVRIPRWP